MHIPGNLNTHTLVRGCYVEPGSSLHTHVSNEVMGKKKCAHETEINHGFRFWCGIMLNNYLVCPPVAPSSEDDSNSDDSSISESDDERGYF